MTLVGHNFFNNGGVSCDGSTDLSSVHSLDAFLVLNGERYFISLDDQIRVDCLEERVRLFAGDVPAEKRSVLGVTYVVTPDAMQAATKSVVERMERTRIAHVDASKDLIPSLVGWSSLIRVGGETDVSFAIEQASSIDSELIHESPVSVLEQGCEFGGHPMPGSERNAEGQYRAKQSESSGVCNEHVQPPKGMMCSELHGNMQKSAEMTDSDMYTSHMEYTCQVTDCNTDYIHFRYAPRRLFKPLEKMMSINQDATVQLITFAGNMTLSNASLQGVLKE